MSRTIIFEDLPVTVGELIEVLNKYSKDAEVSVIRDSSEQEMEILGVSDNADWGNDNEMAIIEV